VLDLDEHTQVMMFIQTEFEVFESIG
jgi:hypothetical protein